MKKFLTLALALVMALALAAPAMAFVEFDYGVDSEYDLDFYLVDYEESFKVFNGTGVWTELPAADRGYVTNEMVGAVVEVLVPAKNAGDDAGLKITAENVRLYQGITAATTVEVDEVIPSRNNSKLSGTYSWSYNTTDEELNLNVRNGQKMFENTSNKDVTAAWLVFGKVQADEASLTATLYNGPIYNQNLDVDTQPTVRYKIGSNKYTVSIARKLTGNGYVYTIAPETATGEILWIFVDGDYKAESMFVTAGNSIGTPAQKARYTLNLNNWGKDAGATTTTNRFTISVDTTPAISVDLSTHADPLALYNAMTQITALTTPYELSYTDGTITFLAKTAGLATSGTAFDLNIAGMIGNASVSSFTTHYDGAAAVAAGGAADYYQVDSAKKLHKNAAAWATPGQTPLPNVDANVTDNAPAKGYLDKVLADFGLNPALVGNVLKPAYLASYKTGIIDEITLNIEPWQAYVTIPDIEVIDPPKTGDAATLAGFVMIVLAAAGVVIFKKVRA